MKSFQPYLTSDLEAFASVPTGNDKAKVKNIVIADPGIYIELTIPAYSNAILSLIDHWFVAVHLTPSGTRRKISNRFFYMPKSSHKLKPSTDIKILIPFPDPNFANEHTFDYQIEVSAQHLNQLVGTDTITGTASQTNNEAKVYNNKKFDYQVGSTLPTNPSPPRGENTFSISDIFFAHDGVGFKLTWSSDLASKMQLLYAYIAIDGQEIASFNIYGDMHYQPAVFWAPLNGFEPAFNLSHNRLHIWLQTNIGTGLLDNGHGITGMDSNDYYSAMEGASKIILV